VSRYIWVVVLAVVAAIAGWKVYAADAMPDQLAILKFEHDWVEALKRKDTANLEKFMSDDFAYSYEGGLDNRMAFIEAVKTDPKLVEVAISDEIVRVHGGTGVVTGRISYKDADGKSWITRYTSTMINGNDGWKQVALQESTVE
jgi:ketosteroid isomerase-like protein